MSDYLQATEAPKGTFKTTGTLTPKQAVFVQELIDNPKQSAAEAARKAYGKPGQMMSQSTATSIAHENLTKPDIVAALNDSTELFESVIVGVVRDWGESENTRKREIALDAAKYGHDKIHGKATVKVEQQTNIVQIAINLTGDGEQPPLDLIEGDISPLNK